jgi:Lrp/AsnC family transcriptional regulator
MIARMSMIQLTLGWQEGSIMQETRIDNIDRKILRLLQEDASLSASTVGERIGLSQSPCWRRIQRLKDEGVIRGQSVELDHKRLGFNAMVFVQVRLTAQGRRNLREFSETISALPEVLECHLLLGNVDFLLRVLVHDIEAYERFYFDKLSKLPEVQEVTSNIVLSEFKHTARIPI